MSLSRSKGVPPSLTLASPVHICGLSLGVNVNFAYHCINWAVPGVPSGSGGNVLIESRGRVTVLSA
ncbi:hypothetical protein [Vulcanisaeta sp. JCM 14467]|uniref:hypothetical protein n=1 Tax=Vulcanisaeta sp. JCM 14467 TaxID=1295370 RepID=UPI000AB1E3E9|nr:hypothetical protein [Vulcanisaeta sp. JCM 14467]